MRKGSSHTSCKEWERMEEELGKSLRSISSHIEASDHMKRQIELRIERESMKEVQMKHMSMKKVLIGVAAACLLIGTAALAGSGIKMYTTSSVGTPEYTSFEDLEKAEEQVGYAVDAVESLGKGFELEGINIRDEVIWNEAGEMEDAGKGFFISYGNGAESISMFARKLLEGEDSEELMGHDFQKTLQAGDVLVGFLQTTNKFVPSDYELTEEDKRNMEEPGFNLAYGSSQVEINTGYHVMWLKDGVFYSLYGSDLSLSADEMLGMAEKIIESCS